jgi:hypothetical protein
VYNILKYPIDSNMLTARKASFTFIALLAVPLALSAFTHIWNSVEFPGIHTDEGHYVRRGVHVSEGLGAQEPSSRYDHPYFGWLFLGNIFSIFGYPDSLSPRLGDVSSIEAVWSVPRILMGLLAVVDTFLIYKIAETRYNRKVAFVAAVLFAVMPYGWLTRRVLLESIQLPFILLSILFAVSYVTNMSRDRNRISNTSHNQNYNQNYIRNTTNYGNNNRKNILLISISGIFIGLAIFTKIPAFTFIPIVGFLVYRAGRSKREYDNGIRRNNYNNNNYIINTKKQSKTNGLKNLSLWFIPVILIPLIWPIYAVSVGQYGDWVEGINFQTTRSSKPLSDNIMEFYSTDPVLLMLGIVGAGYCAVVKRELLFLIWIVPFLIFLYSIDYVSSFFLIPLIPPLCIAPAVMIVDLPNRIVKNRARVKHLLSFSIVSAIAIFGLVNITALISKSDNSSYLEVAAAITKQLPTGVSTQDGSTESPDDDQVTVIGNPRFNWILQYVFDKPNYIYKTQYNLINIHTLERILEGSEKVIMIADRGIMEIVKNEKQPDNAKAQLRAERLSEIYFNTELEDKIGGVEIRTNY